MASNHTNKGSVVTQNSSHVGLGFDESTAIIVDKGKSFQVIGVGGVYVVNGRDIFYSSLAEKKREGIISVYGVKLHVFSHEDTFNLANRSLPLFLLNPPAEPLDAVIDTAINRFGYFKA